MADELLNPHAVDRSRIIMPEELLLGVRDVGRFVILVLLLLDDGTLRFANPA